MRKQLLTMLTIMAAFAMDVSAQTTKEWNFSNWTTGDITETKTVDGLTIYPASGSTDNKVTVEADKREIGGITYTNRFKFNGKGNDLTNSSKSKDRSISFEVSGPSVISIVFKSGNDKNRNLAIYEGSSTITLLTKLTAPTETVTENGKSQTKSVIAEGTITYTGTSSTTIYINSYDGAVNLYDIKVTTLSAAPTDFTLTAKNADYHSLYLPYNVTIPDGLTAYTGTLGSSSLTLTQVSGTVIPANEAVLIGGLSANQEYTFKVSKDGANKDSENSMKGVTVDTAPSALAVSGYSVLNLGYEDGGSVIGFRLPADGDNILANKAYLLAPTASSAKAISIVFNDNEVTGISNVDAETAEAGNGQAYNLAGQPVGSNAKGLVIKNGKLYIAK